MHKNVHVNAVVPGGQEKALVSLELDLQVMVSSLVWAPGTKLGSSARAAIALNCRVILPTLLVTILLTI